MRSARRRKHTGLKGRFPAPALPESDRGTRRETDVGTERSTAAIDWLKEVEQLEDDQAEVEVLDDGRVDNGASPARPNTDEPERS